jgi:hypothetical protein
MVQHDRRTGQQDNQEGTAVAVAMTGQSGQDVWDMTTGKGALERTGRPRNDSKDKTVGPGGWEQECWSRTTVTGQLGPDSRHRQSGYIHVGQE